MINTEGMFESALNFNCGDKNYDPRFFLSLTCQLTAQDSFVDKHLKLIESGCLALAFASLTSKDDHIRQLGLVCLYRIYGQLAKARKSLSAEKQIWLHLLDIFRNGMLKTNLDDNSVVKRIPHLTATFLIKTTQILSNPLDPMFKSISSFLLAKPMLDMFVVPEFLRLFHSSDVINHSLEQEWILAVIRDGTKDELGKSCHNLRRNHGLF